MCVCDCTYAYLQKSSSVELQKMLWSESKHCHLLKIFVVTAPDGYIMYCSKTYAPDNKASDSDILLETIEAEEFKSWLRKNDTILVDRGFNSIYENPYELNIVSPLYLNGQAQFTVEQANFNRGVTAFRYVVEIANRRLREWKVIGQEIPNNRIEIISKLFQLCAAFENMFREEKKTRREEKEILSFITKASAKKTNSSTSKKKIWIQPD